MSEATTAGANRRYDIIPWAAQNALAPVIEMERGEGAYFYDTAGKRYLDFSSQLVNVNLGYQHPKVIAAIQEQAGKLCYIGPHHTTAAREKLGRKLAEIAPGDIQTAFFTGSGSEATEIAMTIARLVTGRRKILAKYRSYHGTTSGSLSASGDPRRLAVGYDHPNIVRFLDPYCHRCPFSLSYPGCGVQCAKSVEEVIEREGPGQIAAVIVEPMTAASGGIKPPPEYFPMLREICDRHGILMIADEVICGFGRTGRWFGIEHWDVVPDLMAVSKGITSGYIPMGAVLMRPHVAASFDDEWFPLGSTQTGNPIACAAACAALDAYENDGLIENAARMGKVLAAGPRGPQDAPSERFGRSLARPAGVDRAHRRSRDRRALLDRAQPRSRQRPHQAPAGGARAGSQDLPQRPPDRPAALYRRGADRRRHRDFRHDPGRGRRGARLNAENVYCLIAPRVNARARCF